MSVATRTSCVSQIIDRIQLLLTIDDGYNLRGVIGVGDTSTFGVVVTIPVPQQSQGRYNEQNPRKLLHKKGQTNNGTRLPTKIKPPDIPRSRWSD